MAGSIREKDFLNDGDSKRKGSKVVKPVRSRTYSSKDATASAPAPPPGTAVNDVAHGVASITQKAHEFVSHSNYYKKEDLIVFDSDEEDAPKEPTFGREATKSLAELEQLFFRCANVMKADDIHLQMRNLHMIMAKQILKDMEYQIKYEEKKKTSREMWDFKHKVHMATFKRIAKPIEKAVDKKKKEKEKSFFVPRWMPDERRQRCLLCRRPFGMFNRRHHCRACGDITCNDCSKTEGPHKIRRCHECIRLGRTIASSMAPATKPLPPTPDSFSSTTGPSHPSHTRTCYIHPNTNSTTTSDSPATSGSTVNRDPSSRTLSLPPAHVPTKTGSNSNGTTTPAVTTRKPSISSVSPISRTSKNSGSGRERTSNPDSFSSASLAGPQNTSFSVPIAWGAGSEPSTSETSKTGLSTTTNGVTAHSGGNNNNKQSSRSPTPLSSPKRRKDTPPSPDLISLNTISVASTHTNGKGGTVTRPHAQSISMSKSVTTPVPWVPDEHRLCCVICGGTFHFFFRRHHCRKCGEVVCNTCSTVENTPDGERYCDSCRQDVGIALDI